MKMIPKYMYRKDESGQITDIPNNPLSIKAVLFGLKIDYSKRIEKLLNSPTYDKKTFNRLSRTYTKISKAYNSGFITPKSSLWNLIKRSKPNPLKTNLKAPTIAIGQFNLPVYKGTNSLLASISTSNKTNIAILNIITHNKTSKELKNYIQY